MKTCQAQRSEETITLTLFPLQSRAVREIKGSWCGFSVFHPQTVMIRAIPPQ
ncbi:MAG: hypothetical protein V7L14_02270 [Nostoc sp.]|uniref:hypothetical protein n=1 Tax=Nostoc sp. TaxID=1180 RepID=UPI002FFBC23B